MKGGAADAELRVQVHLTVPMAADSSLTVRTTQFAPAMTYDLRVQALTVVVQRGLADTWHLVSATAHGLVVDYEPDELDETWEGAAFYEEAPEVLHAVADGLLGKLRRYGLTVEGNGTW